ncbi:MAG TPA: glucose 1-dehydrogenase [Mycobacterium sp.]|uniref:SDR family NAD(P)-dependent oxidoreductase n=1 Tax=Mycobacterium sp. TaxID=1785 RepID=UPI002B720484|nr:glucose 1-dehydrogenase [Mycobacterium sp.]HXO79387.1 glucose 1-dehydrogenase [Mycobacterium sp.]
MTDDHDITDQFRLDGKTALVTGAGKGIGRGIALTFARAGADVALVARTKDDLDAVAEEVRSEGRQAVAIAADVTAIETLADVVEQAVRELSGLDVLVNNAGGVEQLGTYMDMTVAILENAFRFNVSAPFELGRHAVPHMLARGGGAIVNIGSMSGMQNERGFLPYSLAKSALGKFTQLAAIELSPRIRVNAIHPGCVETEALRGFMDAMPDVRAGLQSKTPMRRNGTPEDIARAALFFAAPASSWITGKLLEVDGAAPAGLFPNESPDL